MYQLKLIVSTAFTSEDDMDEDTSMDGPPKESFILTSKTSLLEVLGAKCRTGDCVQPCDVKTSEKGNG